MTSRVSCVAVAAALGLWSQTSHSQQQPEPSDPYPLVAAGWGPEAGGGLYYSRWVEDWTALRAAGTAPDLKALPLPGGITLTLSTETRIRHDAFDNGRLLPGDDYQQSLFRNMLGADLRLTSGLRVYAELGSGYVNGRSGTASANLHNKRSLQQLFAEARITAGSTMMGAMVGRQEFADGPRQLVSLGDGPNLHRTWNGMRLYLHQQRFRVGAFDLRATRLERGGFDEKVDHDQRLQGLNASFVVSRGRDERNVYLEPFWIHSESPAADSTAAAPGTDERHTLGARIWGQYGELKFDLTVARQSGERLDRDIDAWGIFAVQSLSLGDSGWKPRLTSHVDVASGGTPASRRSGGFNPLYSSSNYLGEGRFLSLSNLLLVAPGVAVSPSPATTLSVEYGFARRLSERDAAYAGGMRAYAGTEDVQGHEIGGLTRFAGTWTGVWLDSTHVTLTAGYEYLAAGAVLDRARLASGGHAYVGATLRY
jgi:hypothetical protein